MKKILITGGVGFLGYHLANRLSNEGDTHVTVVDNLLRRGTDDMFKTLIGCDNVEFVELDLCDAEALSKIERHDYVYHLAAVIGVKHVMNNPDRVLRVNAMSVMNLLEWARQKKPGRILFGSTSEAYAGTLKHYGIPIPTPEDVNLVVEDIQNPRTTYALSKIFGEACFINYRRVHGIGFTAVRYHNIYGPRMGFAHVIPELMYKAAESEGYLEVFSTDQTRAFCYVDDAVEATILCCESASTDGATINIGNGSEEIKIGQLAEKIIDIVKPGLKVRPMPATSGSPQRRCPDTSRLSELVGFEPAVDMEEGLDMTWQWYKDRLGERYE
jgi:nucleoside-diphosphate-sugar epimerase